MPKAPPGALPRTRHPHASAQFANSHLTKPNQAGEAVGAQLSDLDRQAKSYLGRDSAGAASYDRSIAHQGGGAQSDFHSGVSYDDRYLLAANHQDTDSGVNLDRRAQFRGQTGMQAAQLTVQHYPDDPYAAYEYDETTFPNLNLSPQDLVNTATELYRRMEDPQFASDDAYWTSLPVHLRNFIRNALPLAGGVAGIGNGSGILPGGAHAAGGQRAMYHLAQQVVNAANQGFGGAGQLANRNQAVNSHSELAYSNGNAAEAGENTYSAYPGVQEGLGHELGFRPHPDFDGQAVAPVNGGDQYYAEESDHGSEDSVNNLAMDTLSISNAADGTESGKKKKKKKKKGAQEIYSDQRDRDLPPSTVQGIPAPPLAKFFNDDPPAPPPQTRNAPIAPVVPTQQQLASAPQPPQSQSQHRQTHPQHLPQTQVPSSHPPPPASQPNSVQPRLAPQQQPAPAVRSTGTAPAATAAAPPSSRAAGKQPMAYAPVNNAPANPVAQSNGTAPVRSARSAGKAPVTAAPSHSHNHNHAGHNHPPQAAAAKPAPVAGASKAKPATPAQPPRIWQTSTTEERERIKEFWLELTQDDRQSLVKIEKDAVLKKMKEQQRHSCACAVCGRKRSAIEDELEVLYDAYYDELEAYAHHQAQYQSTAGAIAPPLGPGPFPGSVEMDNTGHIVRPDHLAPTARQDGRRKVDGAETEDEEYDDDEDYDDDDLADEEEDAGSDEADIGDDDYEDSQDRGNGTRRAATPAARKAEKPAPKANDGADGTTSEGGDFFSFGSSLTTVKGILTVADDLLKNDGQKFMEMMEQLAERRMLREEAAINAIEDDMDEPEEEEDAEADLDEEDEEEDDDDDEDDRMEEGRRMFQIFAARMFEQRVLQSYREKVAQQKQLQFLRELEEEENAAEAREARKAKEAQKKKDKKRIQKEAKDAEKAKKDADVAAATAVAKLKQEVAEKEALKRRDEERQRKEAEKKARAEELIKKDEDKRKRAVEEREREAEVARRKKEKEEKLRTEKEAKDKERKAQEEKDRVAHEKREREDREARERAVLEQAAKKEAIRKEKEERETREREALVQAQAQAQAKLLSQQKASAAKAAAIAVQQAKSQKSRITSPAPPPAIKTKSAKGPVPTVPNGTPLIPSNSAPGQATSAPNAVASARLPTSASLLPTPNITASSPRVPGPSAVAQAQAIPQIGFVPLNVPAQESDRAPALSTRPSYAAQPGLFAPGPSGVGSESATMPSAFPTQMPAFAAGRSAAPVGSNGAFPTMAFGTANVIGAPSNTPLLNGGPGGPRLTNGDNSEFAVRQGSVSQLGLGRPNANGRAGEDHPYTSSTTLAPLPIGHGLVEPDAGSPSARAFQQALRRPEPIGPIQPIGRPRVVMEDVAEDGVPSGSNSRRSSPPGADRIFGSAALGGDDDEVVVPAPRRVSNNTAMGSSWGNSAPLTNGLASWSTSPFASASPGIWGGSTPASAWPGSSTFGSATRFDAKPAPLSGAIGGFPTPPVGNRGFSSGNLGPPGGPIRPPSSQHRDGR